MIAIVDYGMGNLRSLINAFDYMGHDAVITADPSEIEAADKVVLPGVGAFGDAMTSIRERGLRGPLDRQALELRKPVLGICLGMQLFAESSTEHGVHEGSGWLSADVRRLTVEKPRKIPHVGWKDPVWTPECTRWKHSQSELYPVGGPASPYHALQPPSTESTWPVM